MYFHKQVEQNQLVDHSVGGMMTNGLFSKPMKVAHHHCRCSIRVERWLNSIRVIPFLNLMPNLKLLVLAKFEWRLMCPNYLLPIISTPMHMDLCKFEYLCFVLSMEVWFYWSNMISKFQSVNVVLNCVMCHIKFLGYSNNWIVPILLESMWQITECKLNQLPQLMAWFLSDHAPNQFPLSNYNNNCRMKHVNDGKNVLAFHPRSSHSKNLVSILIAQCPCSHRTRPK